MDILAKIYYVNARFRVLLRVENKEKVKLYYLCTIDLYRNDWTNTKSKAYQVKHAGNNFHIMSTAREKGLINLNKKND